MKAPVRIVSGARGRGRKLGGYLTIDGKARAGSLRGMTKLSSNALTETPANTIGKLVMTGAIASARRGF